MKKMVSLVLAVAMLLSVSLASAKTLEPGISSESHVAGLVINATVGEYNAETKTFRVTLYENDSFPYEEVEKLAAGDNVLAGGNLYKVKDIEKDVGGDVTVGTEDGLKLSFVTVGDENMILMDSESDDRVFMHAFAIMNLPAAEGLVYEDNSDPEKTEAVITTGLEEILKIKEEKEKTSIGFNFYSTLIELNENMEIVRIHQNYDVAQ